MFIFFSLSRLIRERMEGRAESFLPILILISGNFFGVEMTGLARRLGDDSLAATLAYRNLVGGKLAGVAFRLVSDSCRTVAEHAAITWDPEKPRDTTWTHHVIYAEVITWPMEYPRLELIAAVDKNGGVGLDNRLPWQLASEWAYFQRMTIPAQDSGKVHAAVFGSRTWDSIPEGMRPWKNCINYVISRSQSQHSCKESCKNLLQGSIERFV